MKLKAYGPVYEVGDKIVLDAPNILLDKTDALCTHSLSTLLHHVTILEYDWCPVKLELTTPDDPDHAYMQCVAPGQPYTKGGTVIFECRSIEEK